MKTKKKSRKVKPIWYSKSGTAPDFCDMDYWSKLSKDEKKWLRQFEWEYYYATGLQNDSALHKKLKQKRDIYGRRNATARTVNHALTATGSLSEASLPSPEDAIIEAIDRKNKIEKK
jgi:hypothetical protein